MPWLKQSHIPSFHRPVGARIRFASEELGTGVKNVWPSWIPSSGYSKGRKGIHEEIEGITIRNDAMIHIDPKMEDLLPRKWMVD